MAPLEPSPTPGRPRGKGAWTWAPCTSLADWPAGSLHQLDEPEPAPTEPSVKRARHGWVPKTLSLSSIFNENKHRVEECFDQGQSQGVVQCNKLVDQLHEAMQNAPIEDTRLSVPGEKHRILTRALAMREVLLAQDPFLATLIGEGVVQEGDSHQQSKGCTMTMSRSSNEAQADATPGQCVLSCCLLLASLYEQTPYGEGADLRRQVYHDFTILKRDFRKDELTVLSGRTGTTEDLFNSVKALDRAQGLENMVGVFFEDWRVYSKRVDPFILADQLKVQVLTLTADGPIGKFMCQLRTMMTLALLHMRLLKELFQAAFAGRPAPAKGYEPMTANDPLDFVDFTEAMARNFPQKHVEGTTLFYAWMYSPEVHAPPEVWEQIFGKGQNKLPTLYEGVRTPDDATGATDSCGDYTLDLEIAGKRDYRAQGSAQAAIGFPWSDDLIGKYLRSFKERPLEQRRRERQLKKQLLEQKQQAAQQQQQPQPQQQPAQQAPPEDEPMQGPATEAPLCRRVPKLAMSPVQSWVMDARAGTRWSPPPGQEPPPRTSTQPCEVVQAQDQPKEPEPIPHAEETGQLALPLGIFMVGLICSGAFTNTQIHVEDLLLMSININIFGAPKVWWWLPKDKVQGFKAAAELMTEGGRGELYTKSISPFLTDREYGYPEHILPLDRLRDLGARRTIQMPGMGIWTMPGYAFHFTVSMGLNVAESANMFLEVMGWTFEKLWQARPLEQYPELEDDMARYMRDTGLLEGLGVEDRLPRHAVEVHRQLSPAFNNGQVVKDVHGTRMVRRVYSQVVKYRTLPKNFALPGQQCTTADVANKRGAAAGAGATTTSSDDVMSSDSSGQPLSSSSWSAGGSAGTSQENNTAAQRSTAGTKRKAGSVDGGGTGVSGSVTPQPSVEVIKSVQLQDTIKMLSEGLKGLVPVDIKMEGVEQHQVAVQVVQVQQHQEQQVA